jgi:hypothetical protein
MALYKHIIYHGPRSGYPYYDVDSVNVDSVNVDSVNVDSVNADSVNVDSFWVYLKISCPILKEIFFNHINWVHINWTHINLSASDYIFIRDDSG